MIPLRRTTDDAKLTLKLYRCKAPGCKASFVKQRAFQTWCSVECGLAIANRRKALAEAEFATAERREWLKRREAQKTLPELLKEAQKEFNAYIRLRDAGRPCICCGATPAGEALRGGDVDAGHYRSVGSAPHLRFDERNVHSQRKYCNRYGAGRAVDYRIGLIARIGLEAVEALEADQEPRKYTRDDVRSIRDTYRARVRALKKEMG